MFVVPRLDHGHDWRGGLEAGPVYTPADVPTGWDVLSIVAAILVQILLAVCLILLAIYIDSFLFAFASTVLRFGVGVNNSLGTCKAAILICLLFYLSTKVLIYYYFVEKCYLVRGSRKPRLKTRLYLINVGCALGPYIVLCWLNLSWRIHYINKNGSCIIGMEKHVLWPLVAWEVLVNVYLTALFLGPVRELYSYKNRAQSKMRKVAMRTFIGVCVTLTTSVVNLSVLTSLNGEQGWVCLLLCTSDVFISVMVLHWVAMSDENRTGHSDSLKRRITRAVTPARHPTPLPSIIPTPLSAPAALMADRLTPCGEHPWISRSPVETTISTGKRRDSSSVGVEGYPSEILRIHVKVKHEISEESMDQVKKSEAA